MGRIPRARAQRMQNFHGGRPRAKCLLSIEAGYPRLQGSIPFSRCANKNINIGAQRTHGRTPRVRGAYKTKLSDGARARRDACSIPPDGWDMGRYVAP